MDNLTLVLGLASIFIAITVVLATVGVLTGERTQVSRSMAALKRMDAPSDMQAELDRSFEERVLEPARARMLGLGRRLTPQGQLDKMGQRLESAGSPAGWDVNRVLSVKVLAAFVGLLLGLTLPVIGGAGVPVIVGSVIGLGALGFFAPDLAIYQIAYNRREQIRKDLPDALDLLTITVEAGLAFDAAVTQVARNTTGPLADEFYRVLQEVQLGRSRADALEQMGERINVEELSIFVSAVVQADNLGIPIAQVLRVQAKEMRIKRSQRAEEAAQKVPVKILFPLIFCILPALFVVVIGPAAVNIYHSFF
ncbi:MAG: type II secretion system F family protein [Actinomycetota bacterium]|nr:type II secretion system F family protein [Actinomycetota bacterium]